MPLVLHKAPRSPAEVWVHTARWLLGDEVVLGNAPRPTESLELPQLGSGSPASQRPPGKDLPADRLPPEWEQSCGVGTHLRVTPSTPGTICAAPEEAAKKEIEGRKRENPDLGRLEETQGFM